MSENNKKKFTDVFKAGTTDDEKKARFEAGGIIATIGFLVGGLFQVAWMSVTPRLLGEVDMGLFGPMMFAFYGVATLIALGIPQTIVTFVSKHYELEFEESLKFITDGIRLLLQVTVGICLAVSAVALALGFAGILKWIAVAMIIVFSVSTVFAAVFWGLNSILNGFQRLDLLTIGNIVFPIGIFATSTVLIVVAQRVAGADSRWDVVGAVAGLGLGHLAAAVCAVFVVKKTGLVPIRKLFGFKSAYGLYGRILRFGGFAAVAFVCMTLVQNITTLIVRIVGMKWLLFEAVNKDYGSAAKACEAAIGHFGTALIYGQACLLITGIAIASIGAMSEAEDRGRQDLLQHYYSTAMAQSMAIVGIFIAIFVVLIGPLAEIMNGSDFPADIMHPLGVLGTFGGAGTALLFVLINIFTGLKKPATAAAILFAVIVLMLTSISALSFTGNILLPMAGFAVSVILGCAACFIMLKKQFNLKFPAYAFYEPLVAMAAPVLFTLFVMPSPIPIKTNLWVVGADIPIIAGPYFFVLWLFDKRRKKVAPAPDGGTNEQ